MKKELTVTQQAGIVADLATRKSAFEADELLMEIAEKGDDHVLKVIREMPAQAKARIMREHDFTKPSFVGLIVDPADVVECMLADPGTWINPAEENSETSPFRIYQDVHDLVVGTILSKDDLSWQIQVLKKVEESEDAVVYFAVAFHHQFSSDGQSFNFDHYEGAAGGIGQLYRIMHEHTPSLEERIIEILGNERTFSGNSLINILSELRAHALEKSMGGTGPAIEMMEDL